MVPQTQQCRLMRIHDMVLVTSARLPEDIGPPHVGQSCRLLPGLCGWIPRLHVSRWFGRRSFDLRPVFVTDHHWEAPESLVRGELLLATLAVTSVEVSGVHARQ